MLQYNTKTELYIASSNKNNRKKTNRKVENRAKKHQKGHFCKTGLYYGASEMAEDGHGKAFINKCQNA